MPQLYLRSGIFFHHFLELCILAQPSPLEQNAPILAKLPLLAIAGGFEYVASSFLSDIFGALLFLLASIASTFLPINDTISIYQNSTDVVLALLLFLSFAFRARSFASAARRQGRGVTVQSISDSFFWHNPALVYHSILRGWTYFMGSPPVRITVPRYFWVLISPTLELGMEQLQATDMKKGSSRWKGMILSVIGLRILSMVVSNGPWALIRITLLLQNCTYWSSKKVPVPINGVSVAYQANPASLSPVRGVWEAMHRLQNMVIAFGSIVLRIPIILLRIGGLIFGTIMDHFIRYNFEDHRTNLYKIRDGPGLRDFRLLTIYPSISATPIRCSLTNHSIWESKTWPPYIAISYCWGSDEATHEIFINGLSLLVTRSAFEVLTAMRSSYKPVTIWIDYICINQGDEEEKDRLIPCMSEIYEEARETVVWLGTSKTADLAIALVNRIFLVNRLSKSSLTQPTYEITTEAARALKQMLKRPWFGRVWIVQEVVRSRGKVTIRYGDGSLSWERFSWFTQSILTDKSQLDMLSSRIGHSGLKNITALQNVSLIRRFGCLRKAHLSLQYYLAQMFRSDCVFNARVDRDRIYGLLGLTRVPKTYLTPNYKTTLREVFIGLVHNILVTTRPEHRLAFLTHAGSGYGPRKSELAHLPSWAPDWTIKIQCNPFLGEEGGGELLTDVAVQHVLEDAAALASFGQVADAEKGFRPKQVALNNVTTVKNRMIQLLYNATPGTEPHANILPNDILQLRGCRFDRIRIVGKPYPVLDTDDWKSGLAILSKWVDLLLLHSRDFNTVRSTDIRTTFFQLLLHGRSQIRLDYTFSIAPMSLEDTVPQDLLSFWDALKKRQVNKKMIVGSLYITALLKLAQGSCGGRCLGISENGYLGLFLPGTQILDWICLFSGARFPFNLRHVKEGELRGKDDIFELIGPAYIQGIMEGVPKADELSWEEILIR